MPRPTALPSPAAPTDPRWQAVASRDRAADGHFFYSVRTTGVYCRPSCGARLPRPGNVDFHASSAAAEQAGFRACLRCRPDQPNLGEPHAALVASLCRRLENAETPPTLAELAEPTGLSPFHLQRVFKRLTGLSPTAYVHAHRAQRLRSTLPGSATVTGAVFEAGYPSQARFYDEAEQVLGMAPSVYRRGGARERIRFAVGECSLGAILVAQSERGVCAILMGDDADALLRDLQDRFPHAELQGGDSGFEALVAEVVGAVEAPRIGLSLPLDVRGTAFQQRVWQALSDIPPGRTASYTEVAQRIGAPGAVRAVAQACGANPLALAIPCHRVVRSDGGLAGYRWGIDRKRALLDREAGG